jgi:hypothetical protein
MFIHVPLFWPLFWSLFFHPIFTLFWLRSAIFSLIISDVRSQCTKYISRPRKNISDQSVLHLFGHPSPLQLRPQWGRMLQTRLRVEIHVEAHRFCWLCWLVLVLVLLLANIPFTACCFANRSCTYVRSFGRTCLAPGL